MGAKKIRSVSEPVRDFVREMLELRDRKASQRLVIRAIGNNAEKLIRALVNQFVREKVNIIVINK
jgi:Arc/MetJ-type ribon-helix-helix transcriptional regulator